MKQGPKKTNLSQHQKQALAQKEHERREALKLQFEELGNQQRQELQDCISCGMLPTEQIHPNFQQWIRQALQHETTSLMGTSYPDFKKQWLSMCEKTAEEYNMQEMGLAINCVESKSMVQMGIESVNSGYNFAHREEYIFIQDAIAVMALHWNVHMEALKKPITEKYKELGTKLREELNNAPVTPQKAKRVKLDSTVKA